jgi:hypothetical protein
MTRKYELCKKRLCFKSDYISVIYLFPRKCCPTLPRLGHRAPPRSQQERHAEVIVFQRSALPNRTCMRADRPTDWLTARDAWEKVPHWTHRIPMRAHMHRTPSVIEPELMAIQMSSRVRRGSHAASPLREIGVPRCGALCLFGLFWRYITDTRFRDNATRVVCTKEWKRIVCVSEFVLQ